MGLSAGVIYVAEPNVGLSVAEGLGLVAQGASPMASSQSGFPAKGSIRVATVEGWSLVMGATGDFVPILDELSESLARISVGRKVFCWITQSTSGSVMFELHEDGTLVRQWSESEGRVLVQIGDPLPEETQAEIPKKDRFLEEGPHHDEWSMLELAEALMGATQEQHFELEGQLYPSVTLSSPQERPWWKLW